MGRAVKGVMRGVLGQPHRQVWSDLALSDEGLKAGRVCVCVCVCSLWRELRAVC